MHEIKKVKAREILDSRGNPTVEVDVFTEKNMARASVPSGASTGEYEALELRDGEKRYLGKGVLKAVNNINNLIAKKIIGHDSTNQREIDNLMIEIDGTENKSKLGANAIVGVSMAVCKLGALELDMPTYNYINKIANSEKLSLPVPQMNVINGGKHAGIDNDFQEHMIMPIKADSFSDALRMCAETYHTLKKYLKEKFGISAIQVADEGGFVPPLKNINERFEFIMKAIEELGYEKNFALAIDAASSEFYHDGKYRILDKNYSSSEIVDFYSDLCKIFNLISIEDGLSENDWEGWTKINSELGKKIQIVGDDLLVTNVKRIKKAIELNACNALLLKVNQVGTISESIDAFKLAEENGWKTIVSHRSGSTEETFMADLATGINAGQVKFGAPARTDRNAKYNQLLRIEEELGNNAKYSISNLNKSNTTC
jgi:enolase